VYDGVKKETMVDTYFGCKIEDIANTVILTPVWSLESFKNKADKVYTEFAGWYKGITLGFKNKRITVINSRIGAPMSGDCALAVSYTGCETVIFSGSAGAVSQYFSIGDMIVAREAVIGEGFSRYHSGDMRKDCFGELVQGDRHTAQKLLDTAMKFRNKYGVGCREGRIFSIDSILGERKDTFEYIKEKGCDAVEMEVSAVFTACRNTGKKAAALILISDLPLKQKNLFEGITEIDIKKYNEIKSDLPGILLEAAAGFLQIEDGGAACEICEV
jgi:purine-nucleoside phosphorylase